MSVCVFFVCLFVCLFVCVRVRSCVRACVYVCVFYVCVYVCVGVCVCVFVFGSASVSLCLLFYSTHAEPARTCHTSYKCIVSWDAHGASKAVP